MKYDEGHWRHYFGHGKCVPKDTPKRCLKNANHREKKGVVMTVSSTECGCATISWESGMRVFEQRKDVKCYNLCFRKISLSEASMLNGSGKRAKAKGSTRELQ